MINNKLMGGENGKTRLKIRIVRIKTERESRK